MTCPSVPLVLSPLLASLLALAVTGCGPSAKLDLLRVVGSGRDGWQHPDGTFGMSFTFSTSP